MYGSLYVRNTTASAKATELTPQLVGALMRRYTHITHVSQTWGDKSQDSAIPNLEQLANAYPYAALMKWIAENHHGIEKSYASRWSTKWNESEKVAFTAEDSGVMLMLQQINGKTKELEVARGMLAVDTVNEQLNHQLACAIVSMSPPVEETLSTGKVMRPGIGDVTGKIGCPVNVVPYLPPDNSTPLAARVSRDGGPLIRAYAAKNGGVEGLVSRLEAALNAPEDCTVMEMHSGVCLCVHQTIEKQRATLTFPETFAPISFAATKSGPIARLQFQTQLPAKVFPSLDVMYYSQSYMAKTIGISHRAGHVHDGHYFCDMPPGMARKVHMLGNLMDALVGIGRPYVRLDTVGGYLAKLKVLLPLNVNCASPTGGTKWAKNLVPSGFADKRFVAGHFIPTKGMTYVLFRYLPDDKAPTLSGSKVVYSPASMRDQINDNLKLVPSDQSIVGFVCHAQPSLWADAANCVVPLNYVDGMVIVFRGHTIGKTSPAHHPLDLYLKRASQFFQSRVWFPYTRLPWPQVSGRSHARVVMKLGTVSAADVAFSEILTALMAGTASYEDTSDLYEVAWAKDIAPAFKAVVVPPAPVPEAPQLPEPVENDEPDQVPPQAPPPDDGADMTEVYNGFF